MPAQLPLVNKTLDNFALKNLVDTCRHKSYSGYHSFVQGSVGHALAGVTNDGVCRVWGVNNKEAPIRLCTLADGSSRDFEFKALDATANPHMALAAIMVAGLQVNLQSPLALPCASSSLRQHYCQQLAACCM